MNIQEDIDDIFDENGRFTHQVNVQQDTIEEFEKKLPTLLIEIWKQHGFGSWNNGLYRLCNPHDFDGLLSQVFHADKDFSHKDCHVYAYTAFGEIHVWSERHWSVKIDLPSSTVSSPKLIDPTKGKDPNIHLSSRLSVNSEALNAYDDADKPLFARARKRLGDLDPGECYGFFPALAMGGAPKLENLKRTKALEHFIFLAQLQQFTLMDYLSRPIQAVRIIG